MALILPPDANVQHTPFRTAEKHFKSRIVKGRLPCLRGHAIIDLSRPLAQEDDEVWQAGWWGPDQDDIKRLRKGKARERGERPELDMDRAGLRRFELEDGREAWVVADGTSFIDRPDSWSKDNVSDRLRLHPSLSDTSSTA